MALLLSACDQYQTQALYQARSTVLTKPSARLIEQEFGLVY